MNQQERLEHIAKIAANMAEKLTDLSKELACKYFYTRTIDELVYQAGYIEGLSHTDEGDKNELAR